MIGGIEDQRKSLVWSQGRQNSSCFALAKQFGRCSSFQSNHILQCNPKHPVNSYSGDQLIIFLINKHSCQLRAFQPWTLFWWSSVFQEISQGQSRTIHHWSFTIQAQFQKIQVHNPSIESYSNILCRVDFTHIPYMPLSITLSVYPGEKDLREREKTDLLFSLKAVFPEGWLVLYSKLYSQNCFHTTSHEPHHLRKGHIDFTSTLAGPFGDNTLEFT